MGKWIKLKDNNNNTVCVKYVPGMDRFIDYGVDRSTWHLPLSISNFAFLEDNNTKLNNPVQPSITSLREYAAELSNPLNATLRITNNSRRFINLTASSTTENSVLNFTKNQGYDPINSSAVAGSVPFFNLVDANTLVDIHVIVSSITFYEWPPGQENQGYPLSESVVTRYSVTAVVQPPDNVSLLPINNLNIRRWRVPKTKSIGFEVNSLSEAYAMLDNAYNQLDNIFGPF